MIFLEDNLIALFLNHSSDYPKSSPKTREADYFLTSSQNRLQRVGAFVGRCQKERR